MVELPVSHLSGLHLGHRVRLVDGPARATFAGDGTLGVLTAVQHEPGLVTLTVTVNLEATGVTFRVPVSDPPQYVAVG